MADFENQLDKLRHMLDEAKIPYESFKEVYDPKIIDFNSDYYNGNGKYKRNQIIYGQYDTNKWRLDGICQLGSYGYREGLIETYGDLGVDEDEQPLVLTAIEVYNIILKDWMENADEY